MVELCRNKILELAGGDPSMFLIGDLNFNETHADYDRLRKDGWQDPHDIFGKDHSATFQYREPGVPQGRIDHILYRGQAFAPQHWSRLVPAESEVRISDHDPVCVEFRERGDPERST